jgi:hypothetical protein
MKKCTEYLKRLKAETKKRCTGLAKLPYHSCKKQIWTKKTCGPKGTTKWVNCMKRRASRKKRDEERIRKSEERLKERRKDRTNRHLKHREQRWKHRCGKKGSAKWKKCLKNMRRRWTKGCSKFDKGSAKWKRCMKFTRRLKPTPEPILDTQGKDCPTCTKKLAKTVATDMNKVEKQIAELKKELRDLEDKKKTKPKPAQKPKPTSRHPCAKYRRGPQKSKESFMKCVKEQKAKSGGAARRPCAKYRSGPQKSKEKFMQCVKRMKQRRMPVRR